MKPDQQSIAGEGRFFLRSQAVWVYRSAMARADHSGRHPAGEGAGNSPAAIRGWVQAISIPVAGAERVREMLEGFHLVKKSCPTL